MPALVLSRRPRYLLRPRAVHALHRTKLDAFQDDLRAGRVRAAQHAVFRHQKLSEPTLDLAAYPVCEDEDTREGRAAMRKILHGLERRGWLDNNAGHGLASVAYIVLRHWHEMGLDDELETGVGHLRIACGEPALLSASGAHCGEDVDAELQEVAMEDIAMEPNPSPDPVEMQVYSATTRCELEKTDWEVLDRVTEDYPEVLSRRTLLLACTPNISLRIIECSEPGSCAMFFEATTSVDDFLTETQAGLSLWQFDAKSEGGMKRLCPSGTVTTGNPPEVYWVKAPGGWTVRNREGTNLRTIAMFPEGHAMCE